MSLTTPTRTKKPQVRKPQPQPNWKEAVEQLTAQIKQWAEEQGWAVTASRNEAFLPAGYFTPVNDWPRLTIDAPEGQLHWEPKGVTLSGHFSVEFYAYPTMYRVHFAFPQHKGEWRIMTDSGIPLHDDWNIANFVRLAKDLMSAE